MKVRSILVKLIRYPDVMLRSPEDMSGIDDLADSILANGLLNPLTVQAKDDEYILLAGGRRLEAIKKLGWEKVPCNVITPPKDIEATITLVENKKREDLNPLEEAQYYEYLIKTYNYTQEQIGNLTGTTAAHVNQMLKLLTLDEFTMGALVVGDVSPSQARELARCPDISYRHYLTDIIKTSGASVLVLKRWVDQRIGFISHAETAEIARPYIEPAGVGDVKATECEICGGGLEYGGLQTVYACNDCYRGLKKAMEGEGASP